MNKVGEEKRKVISQRIGGTSPFNIFRDKTEEGYRYNADKCGDKDMVFRNNLASISDSAEKKSFEQGKMYVTNSPEAKKNDSSMIIPIAVQQTPPPPIRNPHRYNSTIVEVNE
jgi:hypothetical protein